MPDSVRVAGTDAGRAAASGEVGAVTTGVATTGVATTGVAGADGAAIGVLARAEIGVEGMRGAEIGTVWSC